MPDRSVAVLARPRDGDACPPGVDRSRFAAAVLEDACEAVAALANVTPVVIRCPAGWLPDDDVPVWPGTPILDVATEPAGGVISAALDALAVTGVRWAAVIAGDAPDLPGLLVGKLFRGLGAADVAVTPAEGGGLVAVAARLPLAGWARTADIDLDDVMALERLRAAAPARRALAVGPGWHRLRTPADLARLDPGLEGWDALRALLSGR